MSEGRAIAVERLRHRLEAAEAIAEYVRRGRTVFDDDPAVRDAILYQIIVLGEAAKAAIAADPGLVAALPSVDLSPIARMRDRVAHHYWATDRDVVWATAAEAAPALQRALVEALARYV
jgi:uncharacterized protein with HEPN domain